MSADIEHRPWCVEHDPTGTCLGDVMPLPGGGAAWIEGGPDASIVVALGRSESRRGLSELDADDARTVGAALHELADEIDRSGRVDRS